MPIPEYTRNHYQGWSVFNQVEAYLDNSKKPVIRYTILDKNKDFLEMEEENNNNPFRIMKSLSYLTVVLPFLAYIIRGVGRWWNNEPMKHDVRTITNVEGFETVLTGTDQPELIVNIFSEKIILPIYINKMKNEINIAKTGKEVLPPADSMSKLLVQTSKNSNINEKAKSDILEMILEAACDNCGELAYFTHQLHQHMMDEIDLPAKKTIVIWLHTYMEGKSSDDRELLKDTFDQLKYSHPDLKIFLEKQGSLINKAEFLVRSDDIEQKKEGISQLVGLFGEILPNQQQEAVTLIMHQVSHGKINLEDKQALLQHFLDKCSPDKKLGYLRTFVEELDGNNLDIMKFSVKLLHEFGEKDKSINQLLRTCLLKGENKQNVIQYMNERYKSRNMSLETMCSIYIDSIKKSNDADIKKSILSYVKKVNPISNDHETLFGFYKEANKNLDLNFVENNLVLFNHLKNKESDIRSKLLLLDIYCDLFDRKSLVGSEVFFEIMESGFIAGHYTDRHLNALLNWGQGMVEKGIPIKRRDCEIACKVICDFLEQGDNGKISVEKFFNVFLESFFLNFAKGIDTIKEEKELFTKLVYMFSKSKNTDVLIVLAGLLNMTKDKGLVKKVMPEIIKSMQYKERMVFTGNITLPEIHLMLIQSFEDGFQEKEFKTEYREKLVDLFISKIYTRTQESLDESTHKDLLGKLVFMAPDESLVFRKILLQCTEHGFNKSGLSTLFNYIIKNCTKESQQQSIFEKLAESGPDVFSEEIQLRIKKTAKKLFEKSDSALLSLFEKFPEK